MLAAPKPSSNPVQQEPGFFWPAVPHLVAGVQVTHFGAIVRSGVVEV